jgi:signal transduction histidine kinase
MKRRHSLSAKLLGLFLLTALLLSIVIKLGFEIGLKNSWEKNTQPHIAEYVTHLLSEMGDPPDITRAKALADRLPLDITLRGNGIDWSSGKPPSAAHFTDLHSHVLANGVEIQVAHHRGDFYLRVNQGDVQVTFQPQHSFSAGAPWAGIATISGVLLVLLFTYYAIRRLFKPLDTIRKGLAQFGSGDLEYRIDLKRHDELGALSQSVNTMADEIQTMLEAKRQLLLAISHELRSPLTRAKVNLELIDNQSTSYNALKNDLNEIESLLSELLETERLNSPHTALQRKAVRPAALIAGVITEYFQHENIEQHTGSENDYVSLDSNRIKTLIRNLLGNAIRHTPANSPPPVVSSELTADHWQLIVSNQGPAIPKEHLPHLTEPFYRADPSRHRKTGGYGLGLYLCKMIARAHGGELEISSTTHEGTRVMTTIPLAMN